MKRFIVCLVALLAGCSDSSDSDSGSPQPQGGTGHPAPQVPGTPKPGDGDSRATVNGMNARDFFLTLQYKQEEKNGRKLWRYLSSSFIPFSEKEPNSVYEIRLFLKPDGTFVAEYNVGKREPLDEGTTSTTVKLKQKFESSWSVDGTKLILHSFGTADGVNYNGQNALYLRADFGDDALKGKTILLEYANSGMDPLRSRQ